jgi:small conductance mechanosensitive channel
MDNAEKIISWIKDLATLYGPKLLGAILLLIIGLWIIKLIVKAARKSFKGRGIDETLQKFLTNLINWVLKILLFIAVLGQTGIESTSFIAVLGAAGLAIGLALQGSLANFAGGVLIMLFKPFKVGDLIEAQGEKGVVKEIQIFTTKIVAAQNKLVIIPNGAMSNGNITNYTTEGILKIMHVIGVSYDADIKRTKEVLMEVLTSQEKVLSNPKPTVDVIELADSSVNFAVRPTVKADDYWDVYFATLEKAKIALDAAGIEIPYPHRVQVQK